MVFLQIVFENKLATRMHERRVEPSQTSEYILIVFSQLDTSEL